MGPMPTDDQRRAIGKVVSVSASRLVVELHRGNDNFTVIGFDDVHYVARLGSFVMIPVYSEYVVAEVVGLSEKDPLQAKADAVSGGLDKATSAKFLDVVPVGMLARQVEGSFRFGVSIYPSLYADALYALDEELDRIFETAQPTEPVPTHNGVEPNPPTATRFKALTIGRSVVFQDYDVKVRVDEFFGGHAAILGNTGSGKSCTVAAILQSLFEKPDEYKARGATFLVFDVNGEYSQAFGELTGKTGIGVSTVVLDGTANPGKFRLPHWFMDLSEWELLLQASERTQIPVLRMALGLTGLLNGKDDTAADVKRHFVATCIIECFRGSDGDSPVSKIQRVSSLLDKYGTSKLDRTILAKHKCSEKYGNFDFPGTQKAFLDEIRTHLMEDVKLPAYVNEPFSFDDLEECLDFAILYQEAHGNRQIRDYCSQMLTRFKSLRDREELAFLRYDLAEVTGPIPTPNEFVAQLLGLKAVGDKYVKHAQIVVIDMNAVDDEVVEVVAAVIARKIFRLLRYADARNGFPVHLILEEAHRYIADQPSRYAIDAGRIFNRIAKEGRKYGMFLHVASQRPVELSKAVLSQCSNFVIHRIQNPEDLDHIRRMTPFISEAILRRLPSLPKQHALVFGNSVNLPTTFRVRDANPTPKSDDAKIRDLWFRAIDDPLHLIQ
jgi:DNA helicase HerA-like ATPase